MKGRKGLDGEGTVECVCWPRCVDGGADASCTARLFLAGSINVYMPNVRRVSRTSVMGVGRADV